MIDTASSVHGTELSLTLDAICPQTIHDALQRAVAIGPDIEAIVGPDTRWTFAELSAETARIRAALVASGVQRGDHVGVCLGNGARWISLFFAIGSIGAVTVPINTRFLGEEIAYVLRQAKVRTLFIADQFLRIDFIDMLRGICPAIDHRLPDPTFPHLEDVIVIGSDVPDGACSWSDFATRGTNDTPADCTADDILLMQFTSGTTSFPKGVMLAQKNMLTNAFFVGARVGLRPADRYHSARPFFHVAGTTLSILAALMHATTLITMERFEPGAALQQLESERCSHVSGNDTMVLMLLNHPDLKTRKLVLRGGWAAATPTVMKRFMYELGARQACTTYGMSETSPNLAISCWWEPDAVREQCLTRLQPGMEVRIRDVTSGKDCPPGTAGEILTRGWAIMQGYYDKPDETAAMFDDDGWLMTGDLGRLDENGRLEFIGRTREILRVGGENVSPREVEDVLHKHPKIRHAQIVGVPDERLDEVPAAFVVLKDGETANPADLLEWARTQMAGFKAPRYLEIVADFESIGMTASGKIKRKDLRAYAMKILGLSELDRTG